MRGLEYELRSEGFHVLFDADRTGVWVFDLPVSGLTSSQRGPESEVISQIATKFAMKSMLKLSVLKANFN